MSTIIALLIIFGPALIFALFMFKYKKQVKNLREQNANLQRYQGIPDAERYAAQIIDSAQAQVNSTLEEAERKKGEAEAKLRDAVAEAQAMVEEGRKAGREQTQRIVDEADEKLQTALRRERETAQRIETELATAQNAARDIIEKAKIEAENIAGDALEARDKAERFENAVTAMRNIINGYGNEYVIPSRSLLDDLADTYGYTQAGNDLKIARVRSKEMVKLLLAGECDYVEANRRTTAINFIVDAFNGKVDSILSRAKIDNYGKLKQAMVDAYNLVNYNGKAFKDTRITEDYFAARMKELELACTLQEIRQRDIEEQRRIKEQIREEEKARREIEKALRDAAKEEEVLERAMEKVRAQMAEANEEQRATYEALIADLEQKWRAAEERNQRALSMAQQTRSGHVYIISNIGSFGEDVYKIGMTRRLEPLDRIRELGDASVPFAFDVHAMIWSNDAPGLEDQLHKRFALAQMNKVNYRKEFFRTALQEIRAELEKDNLEIKWTMAAEAREYRESQAIDEAIRDNPSAQQDWLNRQVISVQRSPLQMVGVVDDEESEEESA